MRTGRLLLGVAALGLATQAEAGDAADWLLKMSESARISNYQGVVIYRGDDLLETFRVAHRYDEGDERERVQSLTGEVREVLKHDNKVICILPKDQRLTVNRPTPKGLFPGLNEAKLRQIAELYNFRDLGKARVAGRSSRGIAIAPKDQFRYGYEIWADDETAVPLKVSLTGRDGKVMEQMFFTEVQFPAKIPDSAFELAFDPKTMRKVTEESAEAISKAAADATVDVATEQAPDHSDSPDLPIGKLPPGFQVIMRDRRTLPNNQGAVEHVLLSDGLTAISIFRAQQLVPDDRAFRGVSQMGALNAYGRVVGKMHITVVGEAPRETVRMIGDSFGVSTEVPPAASPPLPAAGTVQH